MATVSNLLTLPDFEANFTHQKPNFEFRNGEAIQKSNPTWVHGLIQAIIMDVLRQAGYKAASVVTLKIDPAFQPVPHIIVTALQIEQPYPTKHVKIVIEILSDDDSMSRLLTKCRTYQEWGFQQIYVVDPSARLVFRWSEHRLEEVTLIAGKPSSSVWTALDRELA